MMNDSEEIIVKIWCEYCGVKDGILTTDLIYANQDKFNPKNSEAYIEMMICCRKCGVSALNTLIMVTKNNHGRGIGNG